MGKVGENGRKAPTRKGPAKHLVARVVKMANKARVDEIHLRENGCFICGGPHWARECPGRQALSALAAQGQLKSKEEGEELHVRLLNAMKSKSETPKVVSKGLMYVEAQVDGKTTKAMVDTGATHNFVSAEEAKRLGLKATKEVGWLKAVNSEAKPRGALSRATHWRMVRQGRLVGGPHG